MEGMGDMNSRSKYATLLVMIIIVCMLVFIWGNSLMPAKVSSAFSALVTKLLGGNFAEKHVRKAGHFTEFFLLGAFFYLFFTLKGKKGKEKVFPLSFLALLVPLIDETIQIFNDRGPMVQDIWIDIAGYTCGCLLVLLIRAIIGLFTATGKTNRENREEQS